MTDLVEHDPKHWARKIAVSLCDQNSTEVARFDGIFPEEESFWDWVYMQSDTIPMKIAALTAHALELSPYIRDDILDCVGKSEGARNEAITAEYVDKVAKVLLIKMSRDVTDTEQAATFREVYERLPDIVTKLAEAAKAQWLEAIGSPF